MRLSGKGKLYSILYLKEKVNYLKTVSVAVLDCKQNVSFIVFLKEWYIL